MKHAEDVRAVNHFIDRMLNDNPIGEYNRIEDIYDSVLIEAEYAAEAAYEAKGREWPEAIKEQMAAREPFMTGQYMKFVDQDRIQLFKEIEKRGLEIDEAKVLDSLVKALEKIRLLDGRKDIMNKLSENAYEKCVLNLMLYELLR